jgi:predicted HicB family RNase H-like nuclease
MKHQPNNMKPAAAYIHRGIEREALMTRVPPDLNNQVDLASGKLGTSKNLFVEAALRWYLEQLKKEGSL